MTKTTYKVLAGTFQGHAAGEEFEAELTEEQERRAVERGSIKKATAKKKEEKTDA